MMHALHRFLLLHLLTSFGLHALGSEIINGTKVRENLMRYMASVQNNDRRHVCGGFLINEYFVVTAAHCDELNPTSVVLGTHNLKKADDKMRYGVKRCKHPSYEKVSEGSDIMLLKLSKSVRLNKRVQPIRIPKTEMKIKDKEKCSVAGWGATSVSTSVDEMQMVDVPIVNLDDCKRQWDEKGVHLSANFICAGGSNTDKGFCQGDSGGPLVCKGKPVGVVSFNWNKNCQYPNMPNVYTNISKYLPWIRKILKKKDC